MKIIRSISGFKDLNYICIVYWDDVELICGHINTSLENASEISALDNLKSSISSNYYSFTFYKDNSRSFECLSGEVMSHSNMNQDQLDKFNALKELLELEFLI